MHPDLFSIGFLHVKTYGCCMALGFFAAWQVLVHLCRRAGRPFEPLGNLLVALMVSGVVGSRIAYVHLKDVDTCALKKLDGRAKMSSFRALGLGTVDFRGVYEALQEVGYDGILCVELDNPAICNYNSAEISRKYIKNVLGL